MSRIAGIALGLLACVPLHFLTKALVGSSRWPQRFLGWAGWCAGLRVEVVGRPLKTHVLFAANHVTWLDILALAGVTGTAFVARGDMAGWPLIGWLSRLNDTLFVEREAKRTVHGQADQLRALLGTGRAVALFPEGTTEAGHEVLPFRPSLFASLFPPLPQLQVQPVAIDYGTLAEEVAWVGDEAAGANAKRMMSRRGSIPVRLTFLAPVDPVEAGDRKRLSALAEAEVRGALEGFEAAPVPLYGRQ